MTASRAFRTRIWKPRFTIGGAMIAILAVALILTALRPLSGALGSVYPALGELIGRFATFDTGVVLACLILGAFVTARMMSWDEAG